MLKTQLIVDPNACETSDGVVSNLDVVPFVVAVLDDDLPVHAVEEVAAFPDNEVDGCMSAAANSCVGLDLHDAGAERARLIHDISRHHVLGFLVGPVGPAHFYAVAAGRARWS